MNKQQLREALQLIGRKGGKRSLQTMTPEQRSQRARAAVQARWARNAKKEKSQSCQ